MGTPLRYELNPAFVAVGDDVLRELALKALPA